MRRTPARIAHRNLPLLLLRARECMLAHFRPILKAHDITEQQWRIVRLLVEAGPLEPREIGEHCGISSPSLTGILGRMVELRLVSRRLLAHDRRRLQVSPTARSRALAASMAPQINATYRHIEALMGADFFRQVYQVLDELVAVVEQPPGSSRFMPPRAARPRS